MEERPRKRNYNPADYATVEAEAKVMDKKSLEEYYIDDKDKRYNSPSDKLGAAFGILFIIFVIGAGGYFIAESTIKYMVEDKIIDVTAEVCPHLGEGYNSGAFFKSDYMENKIICGNIHSNFE